MATGKTVLLGALRLLNVKQSSEALATDELEDGKDSLNELIDSWSNQKLIQPALVEVTHTLTASDAQYSIGSSGDINTTRPLKIESAWIRKSNLDYQVDMIENQEWSNLFRKTTETPFPRKLYYRASYPLGEINLYPTPSEANTLVMQVWTQISQITDMTATLTLPPGFNRALKYNLAVEMGPEYGTEASPTVQKIAVESKDWIKTANYGQVMRQRIESAFVTFRGRQGDVNTGGFY
jgi:hypothetical protein